MNASQRKHEMLHPHEIDKTVVQYRVRHSADNLRKFWLSRFIQNNLGRYSEQAWQVRLEVMLEEDFKDLNKNE